ncbi:MAG TPA: hypothetical protein VMG10_20640 [Gemmataceae bacterium]|nr:hypothetical protein [Gemmataceae bacterium]
MTSGRGPLIQQLLVNAPSPIDGRDGNMPRSPARGNIVRDGPQGRLQQCHIDHLRDFPAPEAQGFRRRKPGRLTGTPYRVATQPRREGLLSQPTAAVNEP